MNRPIPVQAPAGLLGSLPAFLEDPLGLFRRALREQGDVVRFRLGPPAVHTDLVLVNSPGLARQLLVTDHDKLRKSIGYRRMRELLGEGLLTGEPPGWTHQRRLLQPILNRDRVLGTADAVFRATDEVLSAVRRDVDAGDLRINVNAVVTAFSLKVAGRVLFHQDLDWLLPLVQEVVPPIQDFIIKRSLLPIDVFKWLPVPRTLRHRRDLARLREAVGEIIARHRPHDGPSTVLDALLAAEAEGRLRRADVEDNVVTFLLAGHETTANALAWTIGLLARHPAVQADLAAEAWPPLAHPAGWETWFEKVLRARSVVLEGLRLYPPAWFVDREVVTGFTLEGGYRLDPGTVVAVCIYHLQRRPDLWPGPDQFRPGRFEGRADWHDPQCRYLPFGAGPRNCIGSHLAFLEMTVFLATFAAEFEIEPETQESDLPGLNPDVTLRMDRDLVVRLRSRHRDARSTAP